MSKEEIYKAIEMRKQVIDGGVLYNKGKKSRYDIIDNVDQFADFASNIEDYTVRMPAKKKRVPLTKEDLNSRFDSGKTMRMTGPYGSFTITSWWFTDLVISYVNGGIDTVKYDSDILLKSKFIDGDPYYKDGEGGLDQSFWLKLRRLYSNWYY